MRSLPLAFVLLVACGRVGFDEGVDSLGAWSAPRPIPAAAMPGVNEQDCTVSSSKLELLFVASGDIYEVTRASPSDPWGARALSTLSVPQDFDGGSRFSPDDLTIYFGSDRIGGAGSQDIWMSTRPAIGAPWTTPTNLVEVNTNREEKWFSPCEDGRYVVVREIPGAMGEIYEGTLGGAAPVPIAALNTAETETGAHLSVDCSTLYFASTRFGTHDIFVAHRNLDGTWDAPSIVTFATVDTDDDEDPWMSPDQRLFVFARGPDPDKDVFEMTR